MISGAYEIKTARNNNVRNIFNAKYNQITVLDAWLAVGRGGGGAFLPWGGQCRLGASDGGGGGGHSRLAASDRESFMPRLQ